MNKRFNVVMAVILFLSSFLPGGAIGLPRAAYAYDPPPPVTGIQTPNDKAVNDTSTAISTPTPGDLSPVAEQTRVQQAMEMALAKYLDYWGPRYQVAPVEVKVIGDWAHGVAAWQSQERTFKTSINLLAHRLPDGQWQVAMPDNEEVFLQWVTAAPGQLLSAPIKSQLRAQAVEAATLRLPKVSPIVLPPASEKTPAQERVAPLQPTPTPTPTPTPKTNVFLEPVGSPQSSDYILPTPPPPVVFFQNPFGTNEVILRLAQGSGISEVGITEPITEQIPMGPEALRVGDDGKIYVLDTVNSRIIGYDPASHALETIEVPNYSHLRDLALGGNRLYVMGFDAVYATDHSGNILDIFQATGEMLNHSSGIAVKGDGTILWQVSGTDEYRMAHASSVNLTDYSPPRMAGTSITQGGESVKSRFIRMGDKQGFLQEFDESGELTSVLSLRVGHFLGSAQLIGKDTIGNYYVLVEELLENEPAFIVETTVWKFSSTGERIGIAFVPTQDLYFVPRRFVDIDSSGNIYFLQVLEKETNVLKLLPDSSFLSRLESSRSFVELGPEIRSGNLFSTTNGFASQQGSITRDQMMQNAAAYVDLQWVINSSNLNGTSCSGLGWNRPGYLNGWNPGDTITSVPYKWGGYATISEFLNSMSANKAAGDKPLSIDDDVLSCASGVDCSGYVSVGVWRDVHKTTRTMGDISYPLESWANLLRGDAVNAPGLHIAIFSEFAGDGINTYESTSDCDWHVCRWHRSYTYLNSKNYVPIRYDYVNEGGGDTTPPDGDFSTPSENQVITNGTVYISGWASDGGSGFQKAHFTATWDGASWRQISPDFTSSPFGFNWDMCAAGVPDGQITLGLDIWDNAGNQANSPHGVRHFTKSYNCSPPPPSCNPNADQVALYLEPNYGTPCVVKNIGQYPNPSAIGLDNDSIASIKVGGNVRAVLCAHDNYGIPCETFTSDDPNLSDNDIGAESVSSAKVEQRTSLPAAPTLLSPSNEAPINEGTSINLSWTATGDQYRGEIWGGPGGTLTFGPQGGTSINIGAQWAGYTYSWHIKAINSVGESAWSETRTFRVKLAAPTNLTGTPTSCTQFNLTWTDNSGNEEGYKIYWYGYEIDQVGANVVSYQGVQSGGETGLYFVRAFRGSSESDPSAEIAVTTPSCATPPSPPTLQSPGNGSVFDESQSLTLCWSATGNEYYGEVWGGPAGTSTFGWQADTCKTIGAQWAGYTYSWHVKAQNSAGPSGWSSTWTFVVRPNAPSGLVAQAVACNQVNLSWADNSGNEEGYRIYRDGISIATVSANVTNYEDVGVGENSSHSYYVKAYRGSIESAASGTVAVWVPICPPSDTEAPVVTWVSPVGNEQTYVVEDETVQLQAEATDNVGVARVRFFRWDAVNLQIVEIGDDYTDPYQRDFDCSILNYGWNETLVEAYDAAGNVSEWQSIWLYRLSPAPDLEPYALPGYPYPVVPSSITGTHEVNLLYAGQPTYFDWYFANTGTATATDTFHVELWVDDILYVRYPFSDFGAGWASGFEDWSEGIATPGWHVVSLITDPDDTVIESDESNNHWYEYFYWAPSAPFADDMENGLNGWTATGLWHQVDETNPYSESYSPTHSWWYGQDSTGNYDTGLPNAGDLTSPPVYIPTTGYYLRFKYLYETETQGSDWDQRWVQISVDGGPFVNILQLYDDLMFGWHQSPPIDLSGYAGHAIQVRFYFDSLDDYANAYRGWYIDDMDISVTPPPTCADPYEPNNTYQQATAIAYGNSRTADLCPNGDYDFYRFTGAAGDKVVVDIDARINGSWLDSYIYLLDSDGTTILALNDDDFVSLDSQLGFNLPHDGDYYIKVKSWSHPSTGSPDHYYTLHLLTDDTSPTAQMASPLNGNYLVSTTTMITVTATDNHAVQRVEFLWHDGNWADPDWQWLGADWYGSDGWSWNLDTGSVPEQSGAAVYIWAFDWVGNWVGAASWDLTLDRTAPQTAISIDLPYGEAQFRDFWVSWWESQDNLSGITSYDLQYRDGAAGTWTNWLLNTTEVYTRFVGLDNHTYYFRVRARDLAGNQSVYTSGNGDAQHTVDICDIAPDAFEVDNTAANASRIATDGIVQTHNMHSAADQDWVKFNATAGITYTLTTTDIGGYADTVLYLYGTNGTTLIDYNDDYGEMGYSSRIDWKPNVSGTYYARVEHWDPWAYGCTTAYGISVTGDSGGDDHYVYLPLVLRPPLTAAALTQQQVTYGSRSR